VCSRHLHHSFAVGAGKAVVSTPYWAAIELLADGRGKLVEFGDSQQIAAAVVEILQDDSLYNSLRRQAYDYGRSRTWPKIGQAYWKLLGAKRLPVRIAAKTPLSAGETISNIEVPEPSSAHLTRLTDNTGLYQYLLRITKFYQLTSPIGKQLDGRPIRSGDNSLACSYRKRCFWQSAVGVRNSYGETAFALIFIDYQRLL
jgi:hypothetical protein